MTSPFHFSSKPDPDMHTIAVQKHGQFLLYPKEPPARMPMLIGFHGYAESAEGHLKLLRSIPLSRPRLCCAVQALNLFYTKSGRIVGSWMTSMDRSNAIADNVAYTDAVAAELRSRWQAADDLIFLGFSQGGPMAYRAALLGAHRCRALVILAGDLPPELAEQDLSELPPVLLCRGAQDEIMPQSQIDKDRRILEAQGVSCDVFSFDGGHEWTIESSKRIAAFVDELAE